MAEQKGEPGDVIKAIEVLCRPHKPASHTDEMSTDDPPPSELEQFNEQLSNNLLKLELFLQDQEIVKSVLSRPDVKLEYSDIDRGNVEENVQWQFVLRSLHLLRGLHTVLSESMANYSAAEQELLKTLTPEQVTKRQLDSKAPPMSPDTLSFPQQKVLLACLQMVFSLGVLPALLPGVGVPLRLRTGFSTLVTCSSSVSAERSPLRDFRLVFCMKHLLELLDQPALGELLLSRHLPDLLAALCQVVFAPRTKELKELIKVHEEEVQTEGKLEGAATGGSGISIGEEGSKDGSLTDSEHTTSIVSPSQISDSATQGLGTKLSRGGFPVRALLDNEATCNKHLAALVTKVYQPLLVRELVQLQGPGGPSAGSAGPGQGDRAASSPRAPAWLRRACGWLLSEVVVKPDGVQSILRGMLHGSEDLAAGITPKAPKVVDWRMGEAIAGIIAHCPRSMTLEEYYGKVGPQVLGLLHSPDKAIRKQFLHVAVSTMAAMLSRDADIAKRHVIIPLLQPLLDCLSDKEIERQAKPIVLVEEHALSQCIEDIHRVLVSGGGPQPLLQPPFQALLQPVFRLLCLSRTTAVNLRTAAEEILVTSLRQSDHQVALRILRHLAFNDILTDEPDGLRRLHDDVMFAPGPTGGAVIISKPGRREFTVPAGDDWEVRCGCVVELIKKLHQDSLTADFFLPLLDNLTALISERVDSANQATQTKAHENRKEQEVLLEIERRQDKEEKDFMRSMVILHLVALLAEDVGPAFLTNPAHILAFAKITLERALQVLRNTDDEMMGMFESETVTMAMGMLTALMGGATELSRQDKDDMQVVLPLLEELTEQHPDPEVKEMASDLRIAIATRGAVWSDLLRDAKQRDREKADRKEKSKVESELTTLKLPTVLPVKKEESKAGGGDGKSKQRPLIEVLSSTETPEVSPKPEVKVEPEVEVRPAEVDIKPEVKHKQEIVEGKPEVALSHFQQAIEELCSPLLPVRGHALISLRRLVEQQDVETLEKHDLLLKVFRENLDHFDSYLYLAAIGGLAALADQKPDVLLPVLAAEYADQDEATGEDGDRKRKRSPEVRMKLGEVLVKTSRALGPVVPRYRDLLLGSLLRGARDPDPLVRASAVSNLGELCKLLRYSLGNIIHEVVGCVTALIKSDPDVEVRKAAALYITLLLQGLGKDATKVLETTLRDVYRLLKLVHVSERDEMVRVHVQLALHELDTIMREQLFPKQTLTKRIRVLDPE